VLPQATPSRGPVWPLRKRNPGTSMMAFVFGLIIVFLVLAASTILDPARFRDDGRGPSGSRRPGPQLVEGLRRTTSISRSAFSCIGLGAKNAILRGLLCGGTDASRQVDHGGDHARRVKQRLRPIIMTSLAFAFAFCPCHRHGRRRQRAPSIATGIIGGMIGRPPWPCLRAAPVLTSLPAQRALKEKKERNCEKTPAEGARHRMRA